MLTVDRTAYFAKYVMRKLRPKIITKIECQKDRVRECSNCINVWMLQRVTYKAIYYELLSGWERKNGSTFSATGLFTAN